MQSIGQVIGATGKGRLAPDFTSDYNYLDATRENFVLMQVDLEDRIDLEVAELRQLLTLRTALELITGVAAVDAVRPRSAKVRR